MGKLKGFLIKSIVLLINAALVAGGVFFMKNKADEEKAISDAQTSAAIPEGETAAVEQNLEPASDAVMTTENASNAGNSVNDSNALPAPEITVTPLAPKPAAAAPTKTSSTNASSSSSSSKKTTKTS
jgi:hypothetical protein